MRRFAKPLYGLTPVPRVRIPPSPPYFQSLTVESNQPTNHLGPWKCESNDFRVCLSHIRRGGCAVHVHRGSDVRVPHQPLLDTNRSAYRIKP